MKNIIISLFLFSVNLVNAQTTFNKRFDFGRPAAVLTNVITSDTGYIFLGITVPEMPPYFTSSIFVSLDLQGNVDFLTIEDGEEKGYRVWNDNFLSLSDTTFAVWGAVSDTIYQNALYFYNNSGQITSLYRYEHLVDESLQRLPRGMIYHNDYLYTIESLENNNIQNNFDFGISKINLQGEKLDFEILGDPSKTDSPESIILSK